MREPASLEALPGCEGSGRIHTPPGHGLIQSSQSASRLKNVPIGPAVSGPGAGRLRQSPGDVSGQVYVGCDMRPGPGVDRVEDVSASNLPDGSAGTVLCIETFEHVFEVRRAFDEAAKGASQVPWCQKVGGPFRAPSRAERSC